MSLPLTDIDLEYVYDAEKPAKALVWVIDGQCLYDAPLLVEHAEAFLSANEVVDISSDYPDHDGLVIRLLKDGETLLELKTSEYFGNILLSDPQVLDLSAYPYGRYVISPHATFDGEKFIPEGRDLESLSPWYEEINL